MGSEETAREALEALADDRLGIGGPETGAAAQARKRGTHRRFCYFRRARRALAILECFRNDTTALGISEIARSVDQASRGSQEITANMHTVAEAAPDPRLSTAMARIKWRPGGGLFHTKL
mgnify:CR=1 FL=1